MPMTQFMSQTVNVLQEFMRPQLLHLITVEYCKRAGDDPLKPLTDSRSQEIYDLCIAAMRLTIEECYDSLLPADQVRNRCLKAIKAKLTEELDKEFPQPLIITG